jgi:hypothetical protein
VKNDKHKKRVKKPKEIEEDLELDWTTLFAAFKDAFEWALDVAAALARDYPEETDAVERVRAFMRARINDQPSHVRVDDVLFTFGLIIAAIERDLGPIGPVRTSAAWFAPPLTLRFPSAADWAPNIPRRLHMWTIDQHFVATA